MQSAHLLPVLRGTLRSVWHGSDSDGDRTLYDAPDEFVQHSSHPVADRPSSSGSWNSSAELLARGPSSGCSYSPLEVPGRVAWRSASYRSAACVASAAGQVVAGTWVPSAAAVVVAVAAAAAAAVAVVAAAAAVPVLRQAIDALVCDLVVKIRSSAIIRAKEQYRNQKMLDTRSVRARRSHPVRVMCCFSSHPVAAGSAPVAVEAALVVAC